MPCKRCPPLATAVQVQPFQLLHGYCQHGKVLLSIGDPELMAELLPVPLEGETDGLSSRFVGKNEKLGIVQEYAGTMSAEIEGTPYTGDFKEEAHDHK